MTKIVSLAAMLRALSVGTFAQVQVPGPTPPAPADLVNSLTGTDSKPEFSNGNTYPAIAWP